MSVNMLRGGESITEQELRSHLALALRMENVGVLFGAGASIDAGGKSMAGIWDNVIKADPELKPKLVDESYISNEDGTPDLEALIAKLELSKADLSRSDMETDRYREIDARLNQIRRAIVEAVMLSNELWDYSDGSREAILTPYNRLLARLQGSRQPGQSAPWVFTTNYDLSIEWAAELLGIHIVNGFSGLHQRRFQPNAFDLSLQNSHASGEARFGSYNLNLVKLHGSISWQLDHDDEPIESAASSIYEGLRNFVDGSSSEFEPLLIQPRTAKYVDSVGFIYGELARRFTEFLSRPNTTLIVCGYGFGDKHINRLLLSGLWNPTLQLVIYHPEWAEGEEIGHPFVKRLVSLALPRVLIRGGGEAAYFEPMTRDLPDPAMTDGLSSEAKKLLSQLARGFTGGEPEPKAEG
ncbi:SIR2 family protein [Oceanicaulis sp.]|uniref:SIR2 family protein n=1 Tax=Oceanicaulis sp. TaxID=1924941 RepID=UPI0025EBCBEC|nr:SIR2 family protein [Oceanicaulis sp.]